MFDPSIGRFLEEDPDSFAAGDADLYRYCGNDPTNATDPSGLCPPRRVSSTTCEGPIPKLYYTLDSDRGKVALCLMDFTAGQAAKMVEIVRAIKSKLGDVRKALQNIKQDYLDKDVFYKRLNRWFTGDILDDNLTPDELGAIKKSFDDLDYYLDNYITVFRDSPNPRTPEDKGVAANSPVQGVADGNLTKVGQATDPVYAPITIYPYFWKLDGRLQFYTIVHEMFHYYGGKQDYFYVSDAENNNWADDDLEFEYGPALKTNHPVPSSDVLIENPDSLAGFFVQYYYHQ
jgi:hypothetical protein